MRVKCDLALSDAVDAYARSYMRYRLGATRTPPSVSRAKRKAGLDHEVAAETRRVIDAHCMNLISMAGQDPEGWPRPDNADELLAKVSIWP